MSTKKPSSRKGRRARGSGAVFYSAHHAQWIGRIRFNGKRREVRAATQGGVVAKLAALKPPGPGTTVAQWAVRWLGSLDVRPGTLEDYTIAVHCHIVPRIGGVRLADLTAHDVEVFASALLKARKKPGTVAKICGTLRTCLAAAVRARVIPSSPAALARRPKRPKTMIDPLTAAELARVITEAPARYTTGGAIALCAASGCRVGESVALYVRDYDPVAGTVAITRTFAKGRIGPPKSPHSVRTIRVPALVRPVLDAAAARGRPGSPLFRSSTGKRFWPEDVNRVFARLLKQLGLSRRTIHQLRHSVASDLVAAGVPVADVARYLGDTVGTVVRVYLHPTGSDPAEALDRLLGGVAKVDGG